MERPILFRDPAGFKSIDFTLGVTALRLIFVFRGLSGGSIRSSCPRMRRDVLGHWCLRTLRALSWDASRVLRVSSDTRCPGTAGGVPGHHLSWDLNRVPRRPVSGDSGDRLRMLLCLGHHFRPRTPLSSWDTMVSQDTAGRPRTADPAPRRVQHLEKMRFSACIRVQGTTCVTSNGRTARRT